MKTGEKDKEEEAIAAQELPEEEKPPEVESEEKPTEEERPSAVKTRKPEDRPKYLNILDHGDSGVGKTWFCGTMIEAGLKVLYIVFNEDEVLTLDTRGITGYDYYVVKDYGSLWPLYLALRKNKPGYEGVILDGLSDLQQGAKDYELSLGTVNTSFMQEAMRGNKRMFLQNWGNLLEMTRHFIDPFLKLPMHKIMTCVSEADDDPKTGKAKIYPALQGSMQQLIAAKFSIVAFSYIAHWGSETYFCLTTQPHESISTKDRTGLCRVQINPKFSTFLDAMKGKKTSPSEKEAKLAKSLVVRPQITKADIKEKD